MQHRITLKFLSGRKRGTKESFPLPRFASELRIGRDPACDVRFDPTADTAVSRSHCSIQWQDDDNQRSYTILDLNSSNGTFVNGRRVEGSSKLRDGDIVEFGSGGPTARIELQTEENDGHVVPSTTEAFGRAPMADHTMKHRIIR